MGELQIAATIINVILLEYITHHICSKHPRSFVVQMAGILEESCILHEIFFRMGIGKADFIAHTYTANLFSSSCCQSSSHAPPCGDKRKDIKSNMSFLVPFKSLLLPNNNAIRFMIFDFYNSHIKALFMPYFSRISQKHLQISSSCLMLTSVLMPKLCGCHHK